MEHECYICNNPSCSSNYRLFNIIKMGDTISFILRGRNHSGSFLLDNDYRTINFDTSILHILSILDNTIDQMEDDIIDDMVSLLQRINNNGPSKLYNRTNFDNIKDYTITEKT